MAVYFYVANAGNGPLIWLVTSLGSLVLYVMALWRTRQSFIGYLSAFMFLSLWLSITSVIQAPVYFFAWAMVVLGIAYMLGARLLRLWREVEEPLSVSASVIVPAAVVVTFLFGGWQISLVHQGITMLLAAGFYALATWYEQDNNVRQTYFILGYSLVPAATLLLTTGFTHDAMERSYILSGVTALQLLFATVWRRSNGRWYHAAMLIGALVLGCSALFAIPIYPPRWGAYAFLLGGNLLVHSAFAYWARSKIQMSFALATALALPGVAGFLAVHPALPQAMIAAVYIILAVILLLAGRRLRAFGFARLTTPAYIVALLIAWLIGYTGTDWVPAMVSLGVAGAAIAAAYYERHPYAIYMGTILSLVAAAQIQTRLQIEHSFNDIAVIFGGLGLVYYIVGKTLPIFKLSATGNDAWLVSGLVTIYLGALAAPLSAGITWATIGCLALAGVMTGNEAWSRANAGWLYVGGGVLLAAAQLALHKLGISAWQIYWYMWSGYFGLLAWVSYRQNHADEQHTYAILALSATTLPFAWYALGGNTADGLILLFEGVALLLVGLWMRYRLVAWWGLSAAAGSVLYQLRDFQFVVLVLLGAGVISLGVYLLARQGKS